MSADSFKTFFRAATGRASDPFDYQTRLACGNDGQGRAGGSLLIDVPTGCGKTAAVVLAWMWNRVVQQRPGWPRRLVYCLPMRSLVEQTEGEVKKWLGERLWDGKTDHAGKVGLHILMGGAEKTQWDLHLGQDAVLIGTQDMLLSRALNRGYGMSRSRWPLAFGLLNNDCLWVFDETQLLGVGVETGAQLDGFRQRLGLQAPSHSWWMSATLDSARLATVDHPEPPDGWEKVKPEAADLQPGSTVQTRRSARKNLRSSPVAPASSNTAEIERYQKNLAAFIAAKHVPETLTLVVVNRVPRAQAIYEHLFKSPPAGAAIALIHSRFRPDDRTTHETVLFDREKKFPNRIVIATQAVEAGVDVSARTLITELAPWSSLVQRFGRCNRYGECNDQGGADIFWINLPTTSDKDATPYLKTDLDAARTALQGLTAAGPQDLQAVGVPEKPVVRPVIRRKDLLDLFDTTPDLCGADLDISRYIRDGEDNDVQVYWRELGAAGPSEKEGSPDRQKPARQELCRVPIAGFNKFLEAKSPRVWRWNALSEAWDQARSKQRAVAGATYLLAVDQGGYTERLGWTGSAKLLPTALPPPTKADLDAYGRDRWSFGASSWLGLSEHVGHVVKEMERLSASLSLSSELADALRTAAVWHDVGKAHAVFQAALHRGAPEEWNGRLLAKSAQPFGRVKERPGFRHELASALLWLQLRAGARPDGDLIAYLIGAHHGKVRLSIRALPGEFAPTPPLDDKGQERLFARGVWQGEKLPAPNYGPLEIAGEPVPETPLDLGYMQMGARSDYGPSWLARMLALRDAPHLGPFRLAYLETLLRAADMRASANEAAARP